MGPAEIISLIPIVVILVGIYLGIKWSSNKSNNSEFELPMKWYYFYTYVRLPLGILGILGSMSIFSDSVYTTFNLFFIIFIILVIVGLAQLKIWGWYTNIILIIIECFSYSIGTSKGNSTMMIIFLVLMALFWFTPNYIYFNKRKEYFS